MGEAFTNETIGLKSALITIRNSRLQFLPQMVSNPTSVTLREQTDSQGGGVDITVSQEISRSQTILPAEIIDVNYTIEVDNDLLFVVGETPTAISPTNTARYIVESAPGIVTSANGTLMKQTLRVQTLTTEVFDVLVGASVTRPRTISTTCRVTGQQSGLGVSVPVNIVEFATT